MTDQNDLLTGMSAIASHMGVTQRRAYHLCENKMVPAFKMGGRWCMRISTYTQHIEALERDARQAS